MAGNVVTLNLKIAGADQVNSALKRVGNTLKAAFAVTVGGDLAQSLGRIADAANNNAAKLRIVTKTTQEFARAQADVLAISQLTGSAIAATTDLYSKLAQSLGRLNATQSQLATVTQAVSQALLVSGATTQGAIGALTQLGQAFSSGVLRGQEFNSVAEQAPRLLQAIADEMKVPVQALRGLAREGKITSDVLLRALTGEGAAKIAAEAANIPLTIGRAFTQLQNILERYIGDVDKATGASAAIVSVITGLANNLQTIAPILAGIGFAAFTVAVGRATAGLFSYVAGLSAARATAITVTQANVVLAASQNAAAINTLRAAEISAAAAVGANAQAIATVRLAEAQIAAAIAAGQFTAAQAAALAASRGFGASLLALVGGPIGAVIVGLTALYVAFEVFKSEAAKASERNTIAVENETEALRKQIATLRDQRRALEGSTPGNLAPIEQQAADLQEARREMDSLREATEKAGPAGVLFAGQILLTSYRIQTLTNSLDENAEQKALLKIETEKLAAAEQVGAVAFDRIASAARGAFAAFTSLITPTAELSAEIARQTKTINDQLVRASGGDPIENNIRAQILLRVATLQSTDSLKAQLGTYLQQRDALKSVEAANTAYSSSQSDAESAADAAASAMERLSDIARDLSAQFKGPSAQANERLTDTLNRIKDSLDAAKTGVKDSTVIARAEALATQARTDAYRENKTALDELADKEAKRRAELADAIGAVFAQIDREIALTGLLEEDRQRLIDSFEAEDAARRIQQGAIQNGFGFDEKERQELEEKIKLKKALARELRQEAELRKNLGQFGQYQFQQGQPAQSLDTFPDLLGAALDATFKNGVEGFKDVLDDFIAGFEKAVEEKGAVTATADVVTSVATFLGNARNAFRENRDAPLRAVQQIASQIPGVVGAVARAVGAIDALFGGKLLGTNNQLTGSSTNVSLGAGGVNGSQTQNFERQRSFFRGRAFSSTTSGLDAEALNAFKGIVDATRAAVTAAAVALGQDVPETIASNFKQTFDKDGKLTSSISEILGQKFNESAEDFAKRNLAEGLLGVTELLAPGIRALSESVRGNATDLLAFAQGALAIAAAVKSGTGVLGPGVGAVETTAFTQTQQRAGESLAETYERIAAAAAILDAALIISGISLDKTREEFVKFAADIADAAGGTQQAAALWQDYFDTFYTAEERAKTATEQANIRRAATLEAIGLDANTTAEQFRETFERLLPGLTPEQIVQYLRAGQAIGAAAQAQEEYNTILTEGAQEAADAAEAAADKLRGFAASLRSIEEQIDAGFTALERSGLTDFERQLLSIDDTLRDTTAQLREQRQAAFDAGASAQELARYDAALGRAQLLAAAQAAAAIEQLRKAGRSIIAQLYGNGAAQAQTFGEAGTQAFNDIGNAAQEMYDAQLNSIKTIQDYLNGQLLGNTSTLTPVQQFDEAQRQFNAAIIAGNAQEATRLADVLLRLGRDRFASSQQNTDLVTAVRAALQGLLDSIGTPVLPVGGPTGGVGGNGQNPQDFDAAARENRLELALQLSEIVRELLLATGDSLSEIAESIGLNVSSLVTDLGVNLTDLSVSTASSLATIAQSLGIELSELAENVGVDLGELSDSQSLINGALKDAIDKLPAAQRDKLKELLQGVEAAARTGGPLEINRAIGLLEDRVNFIGGDTAEALAPFFNGVNPGNPLNSIDTNISLGFGLSNGYLATIAQDIAELLRISTPTPTPPPPPPVVPDAVLPSRAQRNFTATAPEYGPQVVEQLKRTNARLEMLEATMRSGTTQTVSATLQTGEKIANAAKPVVNKPKLVMSQ